MNAEKLFRRWRERHDHLLGTLAPLLRRCRRQGAAEDVHDLRVTIRRLRQLVRLGAAWHGRKATRSFREWSQAVSVATDHVRDMDVAIEWLVSKPGAERVVRLLNLGRVRLWKRARVQLPAFPRELSLRLQVSPPGRKGGPVLARRCSQLQQRFAKRVAGEARQFFRLPPADQHDFRRVTRRWRYLRELLLSDKEQSRDRLLGVLVDTQSVLGERQNLLLAQTALASLESLPDVQALRTELLKDLTALERRIRLRLRNPPGAAGRL